MYNPRSQKSWPSGPMKEPPQPVYRRRSGPNSRLADPTGRPQRKSYNEQFTKLRIKGLSTSPKSKAVKTKRIFY